MVMTKVGSRTSGEVFGDLAIKSASKRRNATAKCTRDCIFITLSGEDYSRFLHRGLEKLNDDKVFFL